MKLSRAGVITALPEGWQIGIHKNIISYLLDFYQINHFFVDDELEKIEFSYKTWLHRDPQDGPAFIWYAGDHIYEKYFFNGEATSNAEGHYGIVRHRDGTVLLAY